MVSDQSRLKIAVENCRVFKNCFSAAWAIRVHKDVDISHLGLSLKRDTQHAGIYSTTGQYKACAYLHVEDIGVFSPIVGHVFPATTAKLEFNIEISECDSGYNRLDIIWRLCHPLAKVMANDRGIRRLPPIHTL